MNSWYFFLLLGYLALVLFIGIRYAGRMKSLEDFFLASRSLPARLIFLSLTASWFGATSILVSTDEAFKVGVSAFWVIGVPAVVTVLLFFFCLAGPVRKLEIISLPDLVEIRYGKGVRHLASLLIAWYMILLAASQMTAIGGFLRVFLGTPYVWSLALGVGCVLAYSIFGGFRSVVVTDVLQFLFLGGGMILLFFFLLTRSSFSEVQALALEAGKQGYFDFSLNLKRNALIALSFTLAWTISPIIWQRVQAGRTIREVRIGLLATVGAFLFLYSLVVGVGILSLPLFLGKELTDPLVSDLITHKTGPVLGLILFVAVVSAVLSTMDTAVNTGALTITRDAYQQVFPRSKKNVVAVGRWATFIVGILAFIVAVRFQSILKTMGLASEVMAEGLFIPGIAMFFLKKKSPAAGFLGLVLGGGFALAGFLKEAGLLFLPLPDWPFSVPYGLGLCAAGFAAGLVIDKLKGH